MEPETTPAAFTREELQALRERARHWGASARKDCVATYLKLAEAADALDAKLARAEAKPDLKLYDPNADTELYEAQSPDGFLGFGAAHLDGTEGRATTEPVFAPAGPGLRSAVAAVPSANLQAMRDALADQRIRGLVAVPEVTDDSPRVFQLLAERTRGRIVDRIARRQGATHPAVEAALQEATKDRPLWQWLRDGGLEKLIALVVSLLPLFV